jgi:hypothetical protein
VTGPKRAATGSASDVDILKTVATFCGAGLLISLILAFFDWDIGSGFF